MLTTKVHHCVLLTPKTDLLHMWIITKKYKSFDVILYICLDIIFIVEIQHSDQGQKTTNVDQPS